MELPKENELSKDGCDWIALNVLFEGGKVWFFAYFVIILAILSVTVQQYWSAAHFIYIIQLCWGDVHNVMKYGDWDQYIPFLQGQKGPSWTFVIYLGYYLRTSACYDLSIYETHVGSHIWYFSLPHSLWTWMTLKIKVTQLSRVCISWTYILSSKFVLNSYRKSHISFQFTLCKWIVFDRL
jgi:hypothetical protein